MADNMQNNTPNEDKDDTSTSASSEPQHPHRKRNIAIGVIIAVIVVAAIACILAFAHPWDAGSTDTPDTSSENTQQANKQQVDKTGDSSNAEGSESTESTKSDDLAGTNEDANNNNSDDSTDTSTNDIPDSSAEEEWPGQSLGYIGPNGEGAINPDDYKTNEEYMDAYDAVLGAEHINLNDYDIVKSTEEGVADHYKGLFSVGFYRSCGELRAREIVDELGGQWVSSGFALPGDKIDWARVYVYFPGDVDEDSIAELLNEYEEVKWAYVVSANNGASADGAET